jgi:hypothetical protein
MLTGGSGRAAARRPVYPLFGPTNAAGIASYAAIEVDSSTTLPTGSAASGTVTGAPWQNVLGHRRWGREAVNLYIRGHLLNDHAGGPSTPINLVPLIGARTSGGPATNHLHEAKVESRLKQALQSLDRSGSGEDPNDVVRVSYGARAEGDQSWRSATSKVLAAPAHFLSVVNHLGAQPGSPMPDLENAVRARFGQDPGLAAAWRAAAPAVFAVIGRGGMTVGEVGNAMTANAELWKYENEMVPSRLLLSLRIVRRRDSASPGPAEVFTLPNRAPDDPMLMRFRTEAGVFDEGPDEEDPDVNGEALDTEANSALAVSPVVAGANFLPRTAPLVADSGGSHLTAETAHGNYARYVHDIRGSLERRAPILGLTDFAALRAALEKALAAALIHDDPGMPAPPQPVPGSSSASQPSHGGYRAVASQALDSKLMPQAAGADLPSLLAEFGLAAEPLALLAPAAEFQQVLAELHDLFAAQESARNLPRDPAGEPARPGVPLFGPPTDAGIGSWAFLLAGRGSGMPRGSSASGTADRLPWYGPILDHRGWRAGKSGFLYIRGHLLNDHLGGPSAPYNLVPLVGAASIDTAKVNTEHEVAMESIAKQAIMEMDHQVRDQDALFKDPGQEIAYVAYSTAVTQNHQNPRSGTGNAAASVGIFQHAEGAMPPHAETDKFPIGALLQAAGAGGPALDRAIHQFDVAPRGFSYGAMLRYLNLNAALWRYEDEHVPSRLKVNLVIERENGTSQHFDYTLVNTLSNDESNMIYRVKG